MHYCVPRCVDRWQESVFVFASSFFDILRGPWHSRYCGEATDGPCGVRIPAGTEDFVLQNVQACCGTHTAPSSVRIWVYPRGVKRPDHDVTTDHLAPSLRMSGAIPLLPPYAFMAWTERTFFFFRMTTLVDRISVCFNGFESYVKT